MEYPLTHFRDVTPPAGLEAFAGGSTASSTYSPDLYWGSNNVSPNTVDTRGTSPSRSPPRHYGPMLLPRVRTQDQDTYTAKHRKARSTSTGPTLGYAASLANPAMFRRSASPSGLGLTTASSYGQSRASSVPRASSPACSSHLMPCPSLVHSRSTSVSSVHSRKSSIASIDAAAINNYLNNAYRASTLAKARTSSLANVVTQMPIPSFNVQAATPVAAEPENLAPELLFDNYAEMPDATTLLDFLTAPNPTSSLVRRLTQPNRLHDTHFWWDIRNIRTWEDFKLETIHKIPGLTQLLTHEIPEPALPKPSKPSIVPETTSALHDAYAQFYSVKVNAALKVALGGNYPSIKSNKAAAIPANPRGAPADFTAHYASDYERNLFGEPKGRVIGLVRVFDQWNSGMRTGENPTAKIEYMRELACLHRHMREHGCRYGFIITEIELVCVRAGTDHVPYYGYLELAPPVQLATHGEDKMTACLALWYLHMLAKNIPLQGQPEWKIDVGHPGSLTRQRCLEKDTLTFKPEGREKRDAKRNRGWIFPEDPLSKKECGRQRKYARTA